MGGKGIAHSGATRNARSIAARMVRTQMRDAAVQSLRHTVRPLKVEVALILKEHPEIGRPVGF